MNVHEFEETVIQLFPQKIAVLIPAFNEEAVLAFTIQSLAKAGISRSDIYIVDDCSTDKTADIAKTLGVNIYTVRTNRGKALVQQSALKYYRIIHRYDWVIFLDGDTVIDDGFFIAMRDAAYRDPKVSLYVGQVKSARNNHLFSASRACEYTYGHDIIKHGQSNFNLIFVSPGCASMYKCRMLAKLKIDHSTLAEDMDLTMQVHRAGGRIVYLPDAIVHTQDPNTFTDYHKQVMRWSRGFWQVVLKHRVLSISKKQKVDWYMLYLVIDALLFNRFVWMFVVSLFSIKFAIVSLCVDFGLTALLALYASFRTKRLDVLYKMPIYYWLSYYNFYLFLRSFIEVIVLRKTLLSWNKVARYDFTDKEKIQ